MGRALEAFAVENAINSLGLSGPQFVRLEKSKRRALFDLIIEDIGDLTINWEVDLEDGQTLWDMFQLYVPSMPDALVVDVANRVAWFVEVEDSNPLTEDKLSLYSEAYYLLDAVYWTLECVTTDRYGNVHARKHLPLWRMVTQCARQ